MDRHFMYVWEPFIDDFHRLGWLLDDVHPIYHLPRGEHFTYLMVWPCQCKIALPMSYRKDRRDAL